MKPGNPGQIASYSSTNAIPSIHHQNKRVMKSKVVNSLFILLISASNILFAQRAILPIQLAGKLIMLEGSINGKKGNFILDTGASGLVLNDKYYNGNQYHAMKTFGVNGKAARLQTKVVDLQIGKLDWKNVKAALISLEHLEQSKGKTILGLLGASLFHKSELIIDFRNMEIQISRIDQWTSVKNRGWQNENTAAVLPFKLKGGMPAIEVSVNGLIYKFGLDTAAETNLMKARARKKLKHLLSREKTTLLRGVNNAVKKVHSAKLDQMEIGDFQCGLMKTLFTDLNTLNQSARGARIDGLMGFELLRQFKVAINYKDKNISFWPYHPTSKNLVAASK